jgi:hypothetical protein
VFLITKGPLAIPHSLILEEVSKGEFYPYTCKGFNLPQRVESRKGIPQIPVYQNLKGFEAANPRPY